MAQIKQITAREILDSRGLPTVEARVLLTDGTSAIASTPSGVTKGSYEGFELRDNDQKRFMGFGVLKAVDSIQTTIASRLIGMEATEQSQIDKAILELDGTLTKSKLGVNATLPVSIAVSKAGAKSIHQPLFLYLRNFLPEPPTLKLPTPAFNVINGGRHGGILDMQEFLIFPASSKSFSESLHMGVNVYQHLKNTLRKQSLLTLVGDEGGFSPHIDSNEEALTLITQAVTESGLRAGYDAFLGIDVAANSLYRDQRYKIQDKQTALTAIELTDFYDEIMKRYHILYFEDPISEDDWEGWQVVFKKLSNKALIVGDALTATNPVRLQQAINKGVVNGIIVKPNQIGTVLESLAVVAIAKQSGIKIVVSNRSGETNDDFIADFSVAVGSDYVKFGAPARGERIAKYNRLLQIEQQLTENTAPVI